MTIKTYPSVHETSATSFDDFKVIHGIGSSVENRLHKAGVLTYRQLAEKSPQDIAKLLNGLVGFTPERIATQDWTGQAKQYASEIITTEKESEDHELQNGQHYAVFTLELLLDGENRVRRTRVMHIQSQQDESWAGWDEKRLQDFFIRQASLYQLAEIEGVAATPSAIVEETAPGLRPSIETELRVETQSIAGQFCIQSLEPQLTDSGASKRLIPANQPFNMRLTLGLAEVSIPGDSSIEFSAAVYTKQLGVGTGSRQILGSSQGTFMPANTVIIDIGANKLAHGFYRIDAIVSLTLPNQDPKPGSNTMAMMEGGLFQVY